MRASACCSRAVCRRSEQELHRPEIAGSPVDEGGLGPPQRVGAIEAGIQANSSDPAEDEPGVLPRREWPPWEAPAREKIVAGPICRRTHVGVDGFPRLLRQLEPDGMSGFILAHGSPIEGCPMRGDVFDPQGDDVAPFILLSIARLNIAKSVRRPSTWSLVRIDQTFLIRSGGFDPIILPLFQRTFDVGVGSLMSSVSMLDLLCWRG